MNSDVTHRRVQLEPRILETLVAEVKETVATDVVLSQPRQRSFGALNLWNIRRMSKYSAHTRQRTRIVTGFGY